MKYEREEMTNDKYALKLNYEMFLGSSWRTIVFAL